MSHIPHANSRIPDRVVVSGALAHRVKRPGHAFVFLHLLEGFARLGCDVTFVDRWDDHMRIDDLGQRVDVADAVSWLGGSLDTIGLGDRFSLLMPGGSCVGIGRSELSDRVRGAVLIDVMGFLDDPDLMALAERRVFWDLDPGFGQLWDAQGLAHPFDAHDDHVTVGLNIGTLDCDVPTGGRRWITTLPPVVIDRWPVTDHDRRTVTSVATWRGPFAPLEIDGRRLGLRAHAFRPFADVPNRAGQRSTVAMHFPDSDRADRELLRAGGWDIVDPIVVAGDLSSYQEFVARSGLELCVAKELYVKLRTGWFSDRSATYLASGRPVVALDTGFSSMLPSEEGLIAIESPDEAVEAVRDVTANMSRHRKAARALAEEHFDSDRVLTSVLERLGS